MTPPSDPNRFSLPVALRHRDYRLLWLGQLISASGSQMQATALLWHISLLEPHNPIYLGMLGLVRVVPIVIFSMLGGVMADALDRKRLMLITQSVLTVVAAGFALMTFANAANVWLIFVLSAISSAATAFDTPARQSLVPRLVPREHLANALSVFTTMFQVATILGPFLAGQVIARVNIAWVYAFNAASFLAVLIALLAMHTDTSPRPGQAQPVTLAAAVEGLRYVWNAPIIRWTMLLDFVATFFSSAGTLLPLMVTNVLGGGAQLYGVLSAAPSAGAFIAGVVMSSIGTVRRQGKILLWAVGVYGLATLLFGLSVWPVLSFLTLACTGAADTVSMVLRNTIRQLSTPDEMRGRMTSVNMIFFMGGPQLGEFEAGGVAQLFGVVFSVVSGGILCILATAWVALRVPALRDYEGGEGTPMLAGSQAAGSAPAPGTLPTGQP